MANTLRSIAWSIVGIVLCGGIGGAAGFATVRALDLDGVGAALVAVLARHGGGGGVLDRPHHRPAQGGSRPMNAARRDEIAAQLLAAFDAGSTLAPITAGDPRFDVAAAYEVLAEIERRRRAAGWRPVGRKIGFTNRSIWPRYNVDRPMWAHVWRETLVDASQGTATFSLARTAEPRIEPEVVFGIGQAVPAHGDARAILAGIDWIAPGFEIVQSPFPQWTFAPPDCTAAFGMHRALVVGARTTLDDPLRDGLARQLATFELTLRKDGAIVERGTGSNVLDSPALALAHLVGLLATQPAMPPLAEGELVTTGTLTDAWFVASGQTWSSDYGDLGIPGLTLHLT